MTLTLLLSIFFKGLAAIIELVITSVITNNLSVSGYGEYSFFVGAVDISFWFLFSGLIKSNTFYLSDKSISLQNYKKKYYTRYLFPILGISVILITLSGMYSYIFIPVAVFLYFSMMDMGSTRLARGRYFNSLIGEYLIGRLFFVLAVLLFFVSKQTSPILLAFLYSLQFVAIILFYYITKSKDTLEKKEISVDIHKMLQYQQSDVAHGLVGQAPVILQFIFGSAFGAGFAAIVVLVKKLVNFISGPAAKIFLPKFSEMYQKNDFTNLKSFYKMIMEIQMIIVTPIAVVLLGFTNTVLSIFSKELIAHDNLFRAVAIVFLIVATLGPAGGLMQMSGKEKQENIIIWSSVAIMGIVIFIKRGDPMFALFGMCAQGIWEGVCKFISICIAFKGCPISVIRYFILWATPIAIIFLKHFIKIHENLLTMILFAGITFIITALILLCDINNRNNFREFFSQKKKSTK